MLNDTRACAGINVGCAHHALNNLSFQLALACKHLGRCSFELSACRLISDDYDWSVTTTTGQSRLRLVKSVRNIIDVAIHDMRQLLA